MSAFGHRCRRSLFACSWAVASIFSRPLSKVADFLVTGTDGGAAVAASTMLIYRKGTSALRLLRLSGSPLPLAALIALAPLLLTASLDGVKQQLREMTSYYPFQPITSLTGVALVFMTNVSYERYWECASRLVSASAQWGAAAAEAIAFDEVGAAPAADSDALVGRRLSQATTLHLFSLFHALALQYVRGDSDMEKLTVDGPVRAEGPPRLPILCGLPEGEYCELARTPHYARLAMVYSRLLCHLNERRARGGLMVEPPVLSVVYAQLSSGFADFKQAAKIDEVPFPFPYAQMIVMLLFCQLSILPVITTGVSRGARPLRPPPQCPKLTGPHPLNRSAVRRAHYTPRARRGYFGSLCGHPWDGYSPPGPVCAPAERPPERRYAKGLQRAAPFRILRARRRTKSAGRSGRRWRSRSTRGLAPRRR